jgi:hypothetical protein
VPGFRAFAAAQQHRFFNEADTSEERYLGFTPEFISKLKSRPAPKPRRAKSR